MPPGPPLGALTAPRQGVGSARGPGPAASHGLASPKQRKKSEIPCVERVSTSLHPRRGSAPSPCPCPLASHGQSPGALTVPAQFTHGSRCPCMRVAGGRNHPGAEQCLCESHCHSHRTVAQRSSRRDQEPCQGPGQPEDAPSPRRLLGDAVSGALSASAYMVAVHRSLPVLQVPRAGLLQQRQ